MVEMVARVDDNAALTTEERLSQDKQRADPAGCSCTVEKSLDANNLKTPPSSGNVKVWLW